MPAPKANQIVGLPRPLVDTVVDSPFNNGSLDNWSSFLGNVDLASIEGKLEATVNKDFTDPEAPPPFVVTSDLVDAGLISSFGQIILEAEINFDPAIGTKIPEAGSQHNAGFTLLGADNGLLLGAIFAITDGAGDADMNVLLGFPGPPGSPVVFGSLDEKLSTFGASHILRLVVSRASDTAIDADLFLDGEKMFATAGPDVLEVSLRLAESSNFGFEDPAGSLRPAIVGGTQAGPAIVTAGAAALDPTGDPDTIDFSTDLIAAGVAVGDLVVVTGAAVGGNNKEAFIAAISGGSNEIAEFTDGTFTGATDTVTAAAHSDPRIPAKFDDVRVWTQPVGADPVTLADVAASAPATSITAEESFDAAEVVDREITSAQGSLTSATSLFTDGGADFTAAGIKVGDYLILKTGFHSGRYELSAVGTTTVTAAGSPFVFDENGVTARFESAGAVAVSSSVFEFTDDSTGIDFVDKQVAAGDFLVIKNKTQHGIYEILTVATTVLTFRGMVIIEDGSGESTVTTDAFEERLEGATGVLNITASNTVTRSGGDFNAGSNVRVGDAFRISGSSGGTQDQTLRIASISTNTITLTDEFGADPGLTFPDAAEPIDYDIYHSFKEVDAVTTSHAIHFAAGPNPVGRHAITAISTFGDVLTIGATLSTASSVIYDIENPFIATESGLIYDIAKAANVPANLTSLGPTGGRGVVASDRLYVAAVVTSPGNGMVYIPDVAAPTVPLIDLNLLNTEAFVLETELELSDEPTVNTRGGGLVLGNAAGFSELLPFNVFQDSVSPGVTFQSELGGSTLRGHNIDFTSSKVELNPGSDGNVRIALELHIFFLNRDGRDRRIFFRFYANGHLVAASYVDADSLILTDIWPAFSLILPTSNFNGVVSYSRISVQKVPISQVMGLRRSLFNPADLSPGAWAGYDGEEVIDTSAVFASQKKRWVGGRSVQDNNPWFLAEDHTDGIFGDIADSGSAGSTVIGTTFTETSQNFVSTVTVGDVLWLKDGAEAGFFTVDTITDNENLEVSPAFTAVDSSINWEVLTPGTKVRVQALDGAFTTSNLGDSVAGKDLVVLDSEELETERVVVDTVTDDDTLDALTTPTAFGGNVRFRVFVETPGQWKVV